jgi:2-polyprenyl-3-methyl-5-hydroxy-6-metoxy-1,4-benzoquinol methylase
MYQTLKSSVNRCLSVFGLRLNRVMSASRILDPAQRSIAMGNSTQSHNSRENMDAIYADPNLLTHYFTPERLSFYTAVREHLSGLAINPSSILDVGCGSGHLLDEVKTIFPSAEMMGVDFSPESIRVAQRLFPTGCFRILSIFDLEQLDRQFDLVLCTEVIEHLEEATLAVDKLVAACRPGGTIVITVPHGRHDTFSGHFNFWTPESFRREFRSHKPFVVEHASYLFATIRSEK